MNKKVIGVKNGIFVLNLRKHFNIYMLNNFDLSNEIYLLYETDSPFKISQPPP